MWTKLEFEMLPNVPAAWNDFLHSRLQFAPAWRSIDALAVQEDLYRRQAMLSEGLFQGLAAVEDSGGALIRDTMRRLQQGAVAVLVGVSPGLFGGPTFQMLKCLTALKICDELSRRNIDAVPVCWIRASVSEDFPRESVQLLGSESEIQSLTLHASRATDGSRCGLLPEREVAELVSRMREIGRNGFDAETLEIIESAFCGGKTYARATKTLLSAFMEGLGMIFWDSSSLNVRQLVQDKIPGYGHSAVSDYILQSLIFPAAVCVIDCREIQAFADAQRFFRAYNLLSPLAWPQASATIADARSKRILERYGLELPQTFFGAEYIVEKLVNTMPIEAIQGLRMLQSEAEDRINKVLTLYAARHGFDSKVASIRERIVFQLNRLREKSETVCKNRQEITLRHLHRACNTLAPNGRIQERELAGIQWPLRYSRRVFRFLYERLDIMTPVHQLIVMD